MEAIAEIKIHSKIVVEREPAGIYKIYEEVIDSIVENEDYELLRVVPNNEKREVAIFTGSELKNVTFASIVIDLTEDQIINFEANKRLIILKVLEVLGDCYLNEINKPIGD
ncbi:hypothetical protein ACI6PS_03660 [Flavobacterium sp. PLA-1-15]|uniref:hypothetical protein n=1 Tax=Flavobacterium sp. PLA-1-15 TaxID=3380533 RepID=UPI003B7D4494